MAIVGALLASCNQKKTEEQEHDHSDGIHQHADGAEHDKHESDTLSQEEFTISKDSSAVKETNKHQHQNGEKHNH